VTKTGQNEILDYGTGPYKGERDGKTRALRKIEWAGVRKWKKKKKDIRQPLTGGFTRTNTGEVPPGKKRTAEGTVNHPNVAALPTERGYKTTNRGPGGQENNAGTASH